MLVYSTAVPEVAVHMIEPISQQICRSIVTKLGCADLFSNRFYFNSDILGASKSTNDDNNPILRENKVVCSISPNLDPKNLKWDMAIPKNFYGQGISEYELSSRVPLFHDRLANTKLIEWEMPSSITLNVNMCFVDSVIAYDVFARIVTMYQNGDMLVVPNVVYDYKLPEKLLETMKIISRLRGATDDQFLEYMKQGSNGAITLNVNRMNNDDSEMVVKHTLIRLLAQIELQNADKPNAQQIKRSPDSFHVEFSVTIQFNRQNTLYLVYPISICNQLTPPEALHFDRDKAHGFLLPQRHPYFEFDTYNKNFNYTPKLTCVRMPWYDNWNVPSSSPLRKKVYSPFFIAHFLLDNTDQEDGKTLIDLAGDLGGYSLAKPVVNLVSNYANDLFELEQPMNISVYADDIMIDPANLNINGTTLEIKNSDPNRCYRVVLSEYVGYGAGKTDVIEDSLRIDRDNPWIGGSGNTPIPDWVLELDPRDPKYVEYFKTHPNTDPYPPYVPEESGDGGTEYGTLGKYEMGRKYGSYQGNRVTLYDIVTRSGN